MLAHARSDAPDESPWWTKKRSAAYLGVTERTVDRLRAAGKLPSRTLGPRLVRIHRDDVRALLGEGVER